MTVDIPDHDLRLVMRDDGHGVRPLRRYDNYGIYTWVKRLHIDGRTREGKRARRLMAMARKYNEENIAADKVADLHPSQVEVWLVKRSCVVSSRRSSPSSRPRPLALASMPVRPWRPTRQSHPVSDISATASSLVACWRRR